MFETSYYAFCFECVASHNVNERYCIESINQSINYFICRHNLNKGDISRLQTNLKLTVLSNTKLRHFWAQNVSWAPVHARKSFNIVLASGRGSQFTERWRHLTCCNEPNCFYGLRLRLFPEWWRHRMDSGAKPAKVRTDGPGTNSVTLNR